MDIKMFKAKSNKLLRGGGVLKDTFWYSFRFLGN